MSYDYGPAGLLVTTVPLLLDAFVWFTGSGGTQTGFADISYYVNVISPSSRLMRTFAHAISTQTTDYVAQTWSGGMLAYRCYIVYGRKRWIAIPALFWTGGTICRRHHRLHHHHARLLPFNLHMLTR
ncbi:hypothetical protein A0H81_03200 [Grifola frondosa]|uniref:Uncharacterized protein n=1 Tax=Grifola frondosa TaxID=5627 RepID=A0A1C7MIP5_GRIFR|nr:hypothetical protein A0H81_03200 [Grifola frondosa]